MRMSNGRLGQTAILCLMLVVGAVSAGEVQITCEEGFHIFVDGTYVGKSNAAEDGKYLTELPLGIHEIRVEKSEHIKVFRWHVKSGYAPTVFRFQVKAYPTELRIEPIGPGLEMQAIDPGAQSQTMDLGGQSQQGGDADSGAAKPKTGSVKITSAPQRCTVDFLGTTQEKTQPEMVADEIPVGNHLIRFSRAKGLLLATVPIEPGGVTEIYANFLANRLEIRAPKPPGAKWVDPAIRMRFRYIPEGSFQMGSLSGDERQHEVTVTHAIWMGETEVTQGQWQAVMNSNPAQFSSCGGDCPVEQVSWFEALEFANAMSRRAGFRACYQIRGEKVTQWDLHCKGYRLPTEAEWEYAARAGGSHSAGSADLDAVAWFAGNSGGQTHRVGRKQANAWGLSDMIGNVWEWCWDWYGPYPAASVTSPKGPSSGSARVERGGGWSSSAQYCRATGRGRDAPGNRYGYLGIRLARTVQPDYIDGASTP